ncbi:MAG: hypothetical protein PHT58_07450 [Eubacteriales bacterium]|nr:hypothetical protein [Eubacteriales bacterium]
MKRVAALFILIILLIGCAKTVAPPNDSDAAAAYSPAPAPTSVPTPQTISIDDAVECTVAPMNVPVSEQSGVDEFYAEYHIQIKEQYPSNNGRGNWINISTQGMIALGAHVFCNTVTGMTVLCYADTLHYLGDFENGNSANNLTLSDASGDGRLDLYYNYSGYVDQQMVTIEAYFDFVTATETIVSD